MTLRNAVIDHYRRDQARNRRLDVFARELERERDGEAETDREICACVTRVAGTLKPEYADALRRIEIGGASLKTTRPSAG